MSGTRNSDDSGAFEFEKVSLNDARKALDETGPGGHPAKRQTEDWGQKRRKGEPEALSDAAAAWLASLPESVKPKQLALRYARLANRLCQLWNDPARCEPLLDELMMDQRGGRQGFPLVVANELATLREHYFKLHHRGGSAWEHVERGR